MASSPEGKKRRFPRTFWVANTMEIFERMAWYGFFAVSSLYITNPRSEGALGFTSEQRGTLQGAVTFILYLLPVLSGALADRYGYKRMLAIAFPILAPAYLLLGQFHSYAGFFFAFLLVAIGAATFKPVIVGTVARTTTEETGTLGFGIFYMMVNIGGFVGPIVAGIVRGWAWKWVFVMSSLWIATNFIWLFLFYKEPTSEATSSQKRTLRQVMNDMVEVLGTGRLFLTVLVVFVLLIAATNEWITWTTALWSSAIWVAVNGLYDLFLRRAVRQPTSWLTTPIRVGNWRFVLFLLVLSGFWTSFNQIFFTMPEYIRDFVNTQDLLVTLQHGAAAVGLHQLAAKLGALVQSGYQVNPEYIINIDAGSIIVFQVLVSYIMQRFPAFTTMVVGTILAGLGITMAAWAGTGWLVVLAILVFSFGEMAASPKSQEYIGRVAPPDKVALFMGYYFVTIALGNLFGGILSGVGYQKLALDMHRPDLMWLLFGSIGFLTAVALVLYNRYVVPGWKREVAEARA
ncbi:MAG TPA: MFS transporter [Bacteroidetes bacterium]|nr:MFS transporter [Bacteroidota bacterium]